MQFAKTQQASFKNVKEKEKPTLVALITILKNSAVGASDSLVSLHQTAVTQGAAKTPEQQD